MILAKATTRNHRLSIAYVFHELITTTSGALRAELTHAGRWNFLQHLSRIVRRLSAEEAAPFLRLLEKWGKWRVYSDSALEQMRQSWAPKRIEALPHSSHRNVQVRCSTGSKNDSR